MIWLPSAPKAHPVHSIFGRDSQSSASPQFAQLVRIRPRFEAISSWRHPQLNISDRYLSKRQLLINHSRDDQLTIQNIGRRPLKLNGQWVGQKSVTVQDNDILEIEDRLLLRASLRQCPSPLWREDISCSPFPFTSPDQFGAIGESDAAWELRRRIALAAKSTQHTLILGPSGSGKTAVARAIHSLSSRSVGPFISKSSANLNATNLIDSLLFGNLKNYPNLGAPERKGFIGEAAGGTLFMDEIGALPTAAQPSLLQVLDPLGTYQKLGEARSRTSDFRCLGATNQPLTDLRADLVARFTGPKLFVPGLNERRNDIPLLIRHILKTISKTTAGSKLPFFDQKGEPRVSFELIQRLVTRNWSTHFRELEGLLRACIIDCYGPSLKPTKALCSEPLWPAGKKNGRNPTNLKQGTKAIYSIPTNEAHEQNSPQINAPQTTSAPLNIQPAQAIEVSEGLETVKRIIFPPVVEAHLTVIRQAGFVLSHCPNIPSGFSRETGNKYLEISLSYALVTHWSQPEGRSLAIQAVAGDPATHRALKALRGHESRFRKKMSTGNLNEKKLRRRYGPEHIQTIRQLIKKLRGASVP